MLGTCLGLGIYTVRAIMPDFKIPPPIFLCVLISTPWGHVTIVVLLVSGLPIFFRAFRPMNFGKGFFSLFQAMDYTSRSVVGWLVQSILPPGDSIWQASLDSLAIQEFYFHKSVPLPLSVG